jgi:putative FmdB family regulatory protein
MPIYEYQCEKCDHKLEKLQKISDDRLKDCPECGKPALKKLVSAAAFRLKGSGWYETDFKTGNKKNVAGEGGDSSSSSGDSSSGDSSSGDSSSSKSASKESSKSSGSSDSSNNSSSNSSAA